VPGDQIVHSQDGNSGTHSNSGAVGGSAPNTDHVEVVISHHTPPNVMGSGGKGPFKACDISFLKRLLMWVLRGPKAGIKGPKGSIQFPDDDNHFVVTERQVARLEYLLEQRGVKLFVDLIPNGLTWERFISESGILSSVFHRDLIDNIDIDQNRRTEAIVKHLKRYPDVKKVFLMDGHGRIILKLLKRMNEEGIRGVKIHVVDINPTAVRWHDLFLPREVSSRMMDIFDAIRHYSLPGTMEKAFIYLNFCGITDALRAKGFDTREHIDRLFHCLQELEHTMISFSVRAANQSKILGYFKKRIEFLQERTISWNITSKRHNFVTYKPCYKPKQEHPVHTGANVPARAIPKKNRMLP